MTIEGLDGITGVDAVIQGLRAAFVTTQLASDRLTAEALSIEDPARRREAFEAEFEAFEDKPMADPLIYKPAVLDAYGIFDDFALRITHGDNIFVVAEIISRMENPRMVGDMLTKPQYGYENGMIHWPGFSTYKWVRDISWEEFEANAIRRDSTGLSVELIKANPDFQGRGLFSRLWFAYATLRTEYYNLRFNPQFDATFPQWRQASLLLDAMLLDGPDSRYISVETISKRGRYIREILPLMQNGAARQDIESLIAVNPQIIPAE